jgi:ABC-type dipeptide/oligopeptide/nickel transport system ATPase component
MSMIELDRVGFRYGRSAAVQNLSLAVEEGSSLGLIGPNGCGKTTILKLVATLLRPSQGRVVVGGFDSRFDARNVRRRIGYVPEQLGVYSNLSVWQYLSFFAGCAGLPAIERKWTSTTSGSWKRTDCRAACGGGSPWRARSSTIRPCCYWTIRSAGWTGAADSSYSKSSKSCAEWALPC